MFGVFEGRQEGHDRLVAADLPEDLGGAPADRRPRVAHRHIQNRTGGRAPGDEGPPGRRAGGDGQGGGALRVGLMQVRGLSDETASRIVERRPYRSLKEFMEKVHPSRDEVEMLIKCGALSSLGRTRPELLWELRLILNGAGKDLFSKVPSIPDYDLSTSIALELETLGLAVSGHPLLMFREELAELSAKHGLIRSADIPRKVGERVEIAGWKVTERATRTSNRGEEMLFVSFSDPWGRFETVFFPDVYRRTASKLVGGPGPFVVVGKVVREFGVETIEAYDVNLLPQLV